MPLRLTYLLLCVLIATSLTAQVGVNNNNPEQALDVAGKIKVTDDAVTPTNGTIRYNNIEEDFQGYSGGEWQSLTKSNATTIASPKPVLYAAFNVPNDATWSAEHVDMQDGYTYAPFFGQVFANGSGDNVLPVVPDGWTYVVDQICVTGRDGGGATPDAFFYAGVRRAFGAGSAQNPQIFISGSRNEGPSCMQSGRVPLLIMRTGQRFELWNDNDSECNVRIIITGVMVQNLDEYFKN